MLHALTQLRMKGTEPEAEELYNTVRTAISNHKI
jgi:hypothetical protein